MPQITYNNIAIGPRQLGPSMQEGEMAVTSMLVGKRPAITITRFPPALISPPTVSGYAIIPSVITAFPGVYSGSPQPTISYEWLRNGVPFENEGITYTTNSLDDADKISVRVTATSPSGTLITTSNSITAILFEDQVVDDYAGFFITGMSSYAELMTSGIDGYWVTGMGQNFVQINATFTSYIINGMSQDNEHQTADFVIYTITTEGV